MITAVACAFVHDHARLDSASFDEPTHIHAAYLQVFRHSALSNMEHPPLVKECAGIGLRMCRPAETPLSSDGNVPASAHRFLFENRISPDAILAAARAPMLGFFAGLALLVFGTTRRLYGTSAAYLAIVFVAFEPTLVGHAGIVHTDVPVALFWLASLVAWGRVLDRRSVGRVAVAGVCLGAAMATKFSALYLIPTFLFVSVAFRLVDLRSTRSTAASRPLAVLGRRVFFDLVAEVGAGIVALGTVLLVYAPVVTGFTAADQQAVIRRMIGVYQGAPGLAERVAAISPISKPLAHFVAGVALVARQNAHGGGITFLNGKLSTVGFPLYFFEAFAIKTALPFLVAIVVAGTLLLSRRFGRRDALLWVPVAYYFLFSIGSSYNIGVRHLMPVYPLLAIAAAGVPVEFLRTAGWHVRFRSAANVGFVVLGTTQIMTAWSSHPFELSYFNGIGGGTAKGYRTLCDSNTDWGQDLRRLANELERRKERAPTICYIGGDDPYRRLGIPDFALDPVLRGSFVAISTTLWDIGPAFYAVNGRLDLARRLSLLIRTLRSRGELVGTLGGSTLLYRLPSAAGPDSDILRR